MNKLLAQECLERWQPRLRLADWDIRISDAPPEADTRGSTDIWWNQKAAKIRLAAELPDSVVEQVVVHELVHVALQPVTNLTNELMVKTGVMITPEHKERVQNAEEPVINQIMRALGLPLIDEEQNDWGKVFSAEEARL